MKKLLLFTFLFSSTQLFAQNNFMLSIHGGMCLGNIITSKSMFLPDTGPDVGYAFSFKILKNTDKILWGASVDFLQLQSFVYNRHPVFVQFNTYDKISSGNPALCFLIQSSYKIDFKNGTLLIGPSLGYASCSIIYHDSIYFKPQGTILGGHVGYMFTYKKMHCILEASPRYLENSLFTPGSTTNTDHYQLFTVPVTIGIQLPVFTKYFAKRAEQKKKEQKDDDD